jgi:hypothetical protein
MTRLLKINNKIHSAIDNKVRDRVFDRIYDMSFASIGKYVRKNVLLNVNKLIISQIEAPVTVQLRIWTTKEF